MDELSQALARCRAAIASLDPWPTGIGDRSIVAGVAAGGLIVGWTSGLGVLALPYGLVLGAIAVALRWAVVTLARPR